MTRQLLYLLQFGLLEVTLTATINLQVPVPMVKRLNEIVFGYSK